MASGDLNDPQHTIHSFSDQIYEPVVLAHIDVEIGRGDEKVWQKRHHVVVRQRTMNVDAQMPLWFRPSESLFHFLDIGKSREATLVISFTIKR